MRKIRKNQYSPKSLRTIVLPTTTLAIAGLIFLLSSTYEPNWGFDWRGIRPEMRDSLRLLANQFGRTTEEIISGWMVYFLESLEILIKKLDEKYERFRAIGPYLNDRQEQVRAYIKMN